METLIPAARELIRAFKDGVEGRLEADEFTRLAAEFHNADDDPKKVLKEKDKVLINIIAQFRTAITNRFAAGDITRVEFLIFMAIAQIFQLVEHILWELKQQTGVVPPDEPEPEPEPQPQPEPQPTPPPQGGNDKASTRASGEKSLS